MYICFLKSYYLKYVFPVALPGTATPSVIVSNRRYCTACTVSNPSVPLSKTGLERRRKHVYTISTTPALASSLK